MFLVAWEHGFLNGSIGDHCKLGGGMTLAIFMKGMGGEVGVSFFTIVES
jgi:hypothetical protein